MLRLAGILIGSALAASLLVTLLGRPQLPPTASSGTVTLSPASAPLPESSGTVTLSSDKGDVTDAEPPPANADKVTVPELAGDKVTVPELEEVLVEQVFAPEAERNAILPMMPEPVAEERWYAFWSPFRSEIAADGFVAKLQESTGMDYRVVRIKTGVYEVAFAYTDAADIETKLERISSATGLDMSGR